MDKKCSCNGEHYCGSNSMTTDHPTTTVSTSPFGKKPIPLASPVTPRNKIGRNEKCPCKSGKKYKNCCISKISPF